MELQKLVQLGLDGLRAVHTFFHRWVTPLVERRQPMWEYLSPMDPNRASPKELPKAEVWSRLDRVLQLRDRDSLEGKLGPLHAAKLSNLGLSGYKSRPHLPRGTEGIARQAAQREAALAKKKKKAKKARRRFDK